MILRIDLYNKNGKWKYGDQVEIADAFAILGADEVYRELVRVQNFVVDGSMEHHYVVAVNEDENGPFFRRHWPPRR